MSTRSRTFLLILLLWGAVLFILLHAAAPAAAAEVSHEDEALPQAGTQLLWESLSRQFVSSVQY